MSDVCLRIAIGYSTGTALVASLLVILVSGGCSAAEAEKSCLEIHQDCLHAGRCPVTTVEGTTSGELEYGEGVEGVSVEDQMRCEVACQLCKSGPAGGSVSDCSLPWGDMLRNGEAVYVYAESVAACDGECVKEWRTCENGTLSGSFVYASCSVAECARCSLPWGGRIQHGEGVWAYRESQVPCGGTISKQWRTCDNGTLKGSFLYPSCTREPCPE